MAVDWMQRFTQEVDAGDQRKQAFSDEQRKQKISQYMTASNNMHKSLALLLNPDTMQPMPGKEQQAAQIRQQLSQVDTYINQLYNPKFNPASDRMNEDPLHKLTDKLHLTKPPVENKNAAQQMQDLQGIRDRYGDTASPILDEQAKQHTADQEVEHMRGLLKKYGASDDTISELTTAKIGGYKPAAQKQQWDLMQGTVDGKPIAWLKDKGSGSITDLQGNAVPADQLQKFQPTQKPGNVPKVGSFGDFMTQAYGEHPTAEQYQDGRKRWAEANASETVGTHLVMVPQADNTIKVVQVVTTSKKEFPGDTGKKEPSKPKSPGKPSAAKPGASSSGSVKPGDTVGARRTPAQNKTDTEYSEAVGFAKLGHLAQEHPTAASDKNLVLSLIRSSAGRVNLQEIEMMRGESGWANKIEQWANSVTSGQLPDDVRKQLVDLLDQKVTAAKSARDAAFGTSDMSDDEFLKKF